GESTTAEAHRVRKLTAAVGRLISGAHLPYRTLETSPTPEIPYSCPIFEAGLASVGARTSDAGIFIGRAG
ncbi:hypothetical protein, partial [Arthrobacter sp. Cr_A7]|uniref:hypothetical protein n=1 Tax=Arthrobacter sp. Cr_A7 TaxID=3031017 RepID=UPI0023DB7237